MTIKAIDLTKISCTKEEWDEFINSPPVYVEIKLSDLEEASKEYPESKFFTVVGNKVIGL